MVKTIVVSDETHKRLRKMGFVGLSINDLIEIMIDYAEEDLKTFNAFLEDQFDDEEGGEE